MIRFLSQIRPKCSTRNDKMVDAGNLLHEETNEAGLVIISEIKKEVLGDTMRARNRSK